jgi:lysozyme
MTKQGELTPEGKKKALAGGGVAALALAASLALIPTWEGKKNAPYFDSVGIKTVCYGETKVQMKVYSDDECRAMLVLRVKQFQSAVVKWNPRLREDPYQLAAHTSFAYNLGMGTYQKSSVSKLYRLGNAYEPQACRAIGKYRMAGGKPLPGLIARRNGDLVRIGEIEVCLTPYP